MFYVWAFCLTTDDSPIMSKQTEHKLVNTCNSCRDVKGADVVLTLQKNAGNKFSSSSTLLRKMYVHCANGFDNVESVYFFYSNPVVSYFYPNTAWQDFRGNKHLRK
jgi:hypothetical protein